MPQLASAVVRHRIVAVAVTIGAAASVVASCGAIGRSFTWNISPSLPRGLYRLRPSTIPVHDAIVSFPVPSSVHDLIATRHYLPPRAGLLKIIVALPGDRVAIDQSAYRVNGRLIGSPLPADTAGRPLPTYSFSGVVPSGVAFVATPASRSFDSRYFGPVPLSSLTVAVPVWTY